MIKRFKKTNDSDYTKQDYSRYRRGVKDELRKKCLIRRKKEVLSLFPDTPKSDFKLSNVSMQTKRAIVKDYMSSPSMQARDHVYKHWNDYGFKHECYGHPRKQTYCEYLCEKHFGINLREELAKRYEYPDVTDRLYHPDGSLKGGKYRGVRVMVSARDNPNAPRTQTVFNGDKPAVIHINSKQAIDPAMSWYHEIAHIEEPGGRGPDRAKAELVADRHGCRMTGKDREAYKRWLISRDSSKDSPAHIAARTELCNKWSMYM